MFKAKQESSFCARKMLRNQSYTCHTTGLYDYKLKIYEIASLFIQISTQHKRKSLEFHTYQVHMHIVE